VSRAAADRDSTATPSTSGRLTLRLWVALLPAPALLAVAFVLISSDRVWIARTVTRHGPGTTFGVLSLIAVAVMLPLYFAVPWLERATFLGGRHIRPPTEGEMKIAGVLLRALILGGLYVVAWSLLVRFG
jgi:hypothetical protein